jgi:hypothetical protein
VSSVGVRQRQSTSSNTKVARYGRPAPRPHGFALTTFVAPIGCPAGVDPEYFRPFAPHEADPARWLDLDWVNLHDPAGPTYRAVTRIEDHGPGTFLAQTYRDVLQAHRRQPETKLAVPGGQPCTPDSRGLLQRRAIRVEDDAILWVGKEAGELIGYPNDLADDLGDKRTIYTAGDRLFRTYYLPVIRTMNISQVARRVNCDRRTIQRIVKVARPRPELRRRIEREAVIHARRALRAQGVEPPRDEIDCLCHFIGRHRAVAPLVV